MIGGSSTLLMAGLDLFSPVRCLGGLVVHDWFVPVDINALLLSWIAWIIGLAIDS